MKSLAARRKASANAEAAKWKAKYDALLVVVDAILLAYGQGPQHRLAVADAFYVGRPRQNVAVESLHDRVIVYLEPAPELAPVNKEEPIQ